MLNFLRNDRGITLIEVIISMVIMSIVMALAFSLYFFGLRSFSTSTSQADIQQEVRLVDEIIKKQLRNALELTIDSGSDYHELKLVNNKFYYNNNQSVSLKWVQNIIVNSNTNGNILIYEIITKENRFNMKNQLLLNNFTLDNPLSIQLTNQVLYYETTD
ncbi:prepilin-type N-terminal cleavage/methylation domain-containing protein [Alkalicella caledoniensis]|uniref:Prepilin-type N-terminal cleavage/methylation domain-containing protein n=1 Tax=Alkalicella caledoniensis TaxID=2731377 RepID=A0A7G9WBQ3_ALKCA|nr:prepilin-type N-terminal cleavage/methylation domain-containing protein [Alkalicella caledoniensis]QNO16115.1 prepilin-type N-terminal cleavage/methylation domain-containing protein [Alkalicella caledoniensis]